MKALERSACCEICDNYKTICSVNFLQSHKSGPKHLHPFTVKPEPHFDFVRSHKKYNKRPKLDVFRQPGRPERQQTIIKADIKQYDFHSSGEEDYPLVSTQSVFGYTCSCRCVIFRGIYLKYTKMVLSEDVIVYKLSFFFFLSLSLSSEVSSIRAG